MYEDYPAIAGVDVNNHMRQGRTPLHLAVRNNVKVEAVRLLLRHGAKRRQQGYVSLGGVTLCIERPRRRLRDHARP